MMRKIYLVAGEASGDSHGYELLQSLQRLDNDLEFAGAGGPAMRKATTGRIEDWSDHAVIGVIDVLKNYGYFKGQMVRMVEEIHNWQPQAVVLIDYPGFNLRLAARLRSENYSGKIIYYISPQVWAWNRGRIPKMAKILDLMLCIFPFEKPLYEKSGLSTRFVGHPMVDKLSSLREAAEREHKLIALLPGSRLREIRRIFPVMLEACKLLDDDGYHFAATAPKPALCEVMKEQMKTAAVNPESIRITTGDAYQLMQQASAGLVASGTATLESAFFQLPFALVYKVSWATYWPAKFLIKVPYIGMVNILAERKVIPEYIQSQATAGNLAAEVLRLTTDTEYRAELLSGCQDAIAKLGGGGASNNAAQFILQELND